MSAPLLHDHSRQVTGLYPDSPASALLRRPLQEGTACFLRPSPPTAFRTTDHRNRCRYRHRCLPLPSTAFHRLPRLPITHPAALDHLCRRYASSSGLLETAVLVSMPSGRHQGVIRASSGRHQGAIRMSSCGGGTRVRVGVRVRVRVRVTCSRRRCPRRCGGGTRTDLR